MRKFIILALTAATLSTPSFASPSTAAPATDQRSERIEEGRRMCLRAEELREENEIDELLLIQQRSRLDGMISYAGSRGRQLYRKEVFELHKAEVENQNRKANIQSVLEKCRELGLIDR
jgi:hypothetical protein